MLDFENMNIQQEMKDYLTRMNTLTMPLLRLWERVLEDPKNPKSYLFTDDEVLVIKHVAEAYLSGDKSGK